MDFNRYRKPEQKGNGQSYNILELIDKSQIKKLFDSFYTMTGIPYAILDSQNKPIAMKGIQEICQKYHWTHNASQLRCQRSYGSIFDHLQETYVGDRCLNGLMEYGTPIVLEGQHLATIYLGQVLHEPPDEEFFRKQAEELGIDQEKYMEAVRKIPVIPKDDVVKIIEFFNQLGEVLAAIGLERRQHQRLAEVLWRSPDALSISRRSDGKYVEVNDAWLKMTGFTEEETIDHTSVELGIWPDPQKRDELVRLIMQQGSVRDYETIFRSRTGELLDYSVSVEPIEICNEPYLIFVSKDITESTKMQEALRLSEEQFSKAFNLSPNAESISSLIDGRFIAVNDSFCNIVGYTREEIMGSTSESLDVWLNKSDRQFVRHMILTDQPIKDMEIYFQRKAVESWIGLYSAVKLIIDGEPCLLSIASDITARRQAEEEIRYLSYHDKLTGLLNRAFFEIELNRFDTKRHLPISIIVGDVNGLKLINDALGHQKGDKLLILLSKVFKRSCREDDVVARWGGDEFIALLPKCNRDTAQEIVNRIYENCLNIDEMPIQTSLSLGFATKTDFATDINDLIKEAEDKMYRHKLLVDRSTRNSFLVSLENTLWSRSHETKEHCARISNIAEKIGQSIDLPECDLDNIKLLSMLHDIGKIAIPNSILDKPGKLTPDEWESIKKHPE
ncbi:MAG: PocR ligand-binding domain-containing protein, partial [Ignavibacteriales bacterium]